MTGLEIALAGYLAFGQLIPEGQQEIVKYGGLQVIHADGAAAVFGRAGDGIHSERSFRMVQ